MLVSSVIDTSLNVVEQGTVRLREKKINQDVINQKINELLAAKKKREKKKEVEGSSSFIDSAIVPDNEELPSWNSVTRDENSHDGNLMMD